MPVSAYGVSFGGGMGIDVLFSKRHIAVYSYQELVLGVARMSLGTYVNMKAGLVFDSPMAKDYAGRSYSVTLSFNFLGSKMKKKMTQQLPMLRPPAGADLALKGASKWVTTARALLRDATPHLSNIKSLQNYAVTLFWGRPFMTSALGFSVGVQLGGSASSVLSGARAWYQLWGDGEKKF